MLKKRHVSGVLAAIGLVAVGGVPAQASSPSTAAYVQRCTDLGRGNLCIDVNGRVGQVGVIGVGYWKREGDSIHVRLGWQNTTGGGANFSKNVHGPLTPGMNTGTEKWRTYLAAGCVYPLIEVVGQGTLKGKEVCVPA